MRHRDPLAPVEFVTTLLIAFSLLIGGAFAIFNPKHSSFGPTVCVTVTNGNYAGYVNRIESSDPMYQQFLKQAPSTTPPSGTTAFSKGVELCAARPTVRQQLWASVGFSGEALFVFGALGITWNLARRARKSGFFVARTSRGLSRLGAFLIVGTVVEHLLDWLAAHEILSTLVPAGSPTWNGIGSLASPAMLVVGAGLLTLGRVMAHAVAMQDELDVTV